MCEWLNIEGAIELSILSRCAPPTCCVNLHWKEPSLAKRGLARKGGHAIQLSILLRSALPHMQYNPCMATIAGGLDVLIIKPAHARRHYEREVAAYDVQTKRCDVYGQGSSYPLRGMLIYDGLHYDALALAGALPQGHSSW